MSIAISLLEAHLENTLNNQRVSAKESKVADANRLAVEAKEIEDAIQILKENR